MVQNSTKLKCDKGHTADKVKNAIVDGKFGAYCMAHISGTARMTTAQAAAWYRARDYEDHRRDVVQAKTPQGKINPEFVREYPDQAAEMFTREDIEQALRDV